MGPVDYVALRLVRHYLPDGVVRPARFHHSGRHRDQCAGRGNPAFHGRHRWRGGDRRRPPGPDLRLWRPVRRRRGVASSRSPARSARGSLRRSNAGHACPRIGRQPFPRDLGVKGGPRPEWLTVIQAPLRQYLSNGGGPVDMILSNSVLEHVDDLAGAVADLARVTRPGGQHFHFIDLRDHFFKHPFEMLCYSEKSWRTFLNPGSNLNRLRVWDYERLFLASFPRVTVQVRYSDLPAFHAARARIRPEFLSGDEARDAVTQILLRASLA